jgi:hypothetical protein
MFKNQDTSIVVSADCTASHLAYFPVAFLLCLIPCVCSVLRHVGQQVKYTGFRAITAGLQADTFIEAFDVEKQKQEYSALLADREEHAAMVRSSVHVMFVPRCVGNQVRCHHMVV